MRANADPTIWTVDDDGVADFLNIQDAIGNASSGDKIFVYKGIYFEHLTINKSITIEGEDRKYTIIDGSRNGTVVDIRSDNVGFSGFTVRRSGTKPTDGGIRAVQASNVSITNNDVTENTNGISLHFSNSSTLSKNYILSNNFEGIYIYSSMSNIVCENLIQNNTDGIYVYSSVDNTVQDNLIVGNAFCGIYVHSSVDNFFLGNTIRSSGFYGAYLTFTSGNIFCHNNFDNVVQLWYANSANSWDCGAEGNYWSDYEGEDSENDGIGDVAYETEADNWDNFPLMGTYASFSITAGEEAFRIAAISNSTVTNLTYLIGTETGNRILLFHVVGQDGGIAFCRMSLPAVLMTYPYIVLLDGELVTPSSIWMSNGNATLYFTYPDGNLTVRIISSQTLRLYEELLHDYLELQTSFSDLNATFYTLLGNYTAILSDLVQLQSSYQDLSQSFQQFYEMNSTYYALLDDFANLQNQFSELNTTYYIVADDHVALQIDFNGLNSTYQQLISNYAQLQAIHILLNASYQAHLVDASDLSLNYQKIMYAISAMMGVFLIAIVYLSKQAHTSTTKHLRAESPD